MAEQIASLYAEITADTTGLSRGLTNAKTALTGAKAEIQKSTSGIAGLFKNIGSVAIGTFAGLNVIPGILSGIGEAAIGMNARMEQSRVAFTQLLGGADEANKFLKDLTTFAAKTPFEMEGLTEASKAMLAYGFEAKQIIPLLTSVGNASAAMGGGSEMIDRVTRALGQMSAKTKVSAGEMLQLTETGLPAWQMLADAIGKPVAEVMKLAEQGKISSDVMIAAFQKYSDQNFGGMMEKQAKTFGGAMSTIKDSVLIAASTAFKPLFDAISSGAVALSTFVQSEQFTAWAGAVAAGVGQVIGMFTSFATGAGPQASGIMQTLGTFASTILVPALQRMGTFFQENILPVLQEFGTEVGPIVADIFGTIGGIMNDVVLPVLKELAPQFADFAGPVLKEGLVIALELVKGGLTLLRDAFDVLSDALPPATELLRGIREAFDYIGRSISGLIGSIQRLIGWFGSLGDALPDWLRGKSPPPLAGWLDYVAESMGGVSGMARSLQMGNTFAAPGVPSLTGGGVAPVTIYVDRVDSTERLDELAARVRYANERTGRYNAAWTGVPS